MSIKETVLALADAVPTSAQSAAELAARLDAARDAAAEVLDSALLAFGQLQEALATVTRERDELKATAEGLAGLRPELPPRPQDGTGLPRFGIRWNGPSWPLAVSMDDGYWTPWHLADAARRERDEARASLASALEQAAFMRREMEPCEVHHGARRSCGQCLSSAEAHVADLRAQLADVAAEAEVARLRESEARMRAALKAINSCVAWSDTAQAWYLIGRERTQPALALVKAALEQGAREIGSELIARAEVRG